MDESMVTCFLTHGVDHNLLFSGDYISALRGCCPSKFLHALETDKGLIAHTTTGTQKWRNTAQYWLRRHIEWLDALYLWGLRIHALVHLLTYLFTYSSLCAIKLAMSPKRLKLERWLLLTAYKFLHGLSIAAIKSYDLEWPLSEIQDHWFLKFRKPGEIQLSNDSDAM